MKQRMRSPVVMIHGAFCGGWAFDGWRALFEAEGYDVHTPTLRHHDGGATNLKALARTSMADYAHDLERQLDGLDAPPVVIGHSLGGLLAQMLAARRQIAALVLLAPSAPWGMLPSTPFELASAQILYMSGAFWQQALEPHHWIAAANALDRVPEPERDAIFARFVPESGLATFEIMHWMLDLKRATQVDARAVTCPVLCLAGARDRVNPPVTVRRLARRYGGRARYEEIPGHSHWLIGEPGWEKIAHGSLSWLERILGHDEERIEQGL